MAVWIPKATIRIANNRNVYVASQAVQSRDCHSKPRIIKNPTTASLKRGTGGRSSFNGIVCTIFGCNGFIGRYVCNRLGKIGTQIILPHRCDPYRVRQLKLCGDLGQVLYRPFDLRDEESIIKAIKYSNVVINLIGSDFETKKFDYEAIHVEAARTLARLAKQCNVEQFIHVSCLNAAEYVPPKILPDGSAILKAKWRGECAVREEFPEATIVRPAVVYGQEDTFITHYMNPMRRTIGGLIPLWERGEATEKQPVHVSDVAAGIVAIATNPRNAGKIYQFVGPKRYKLNELINWFYNIITYGIEETEDNFSITNISNNPLFQTQVLINEMIYNLHPAVHLNWEILEREHVSDKVVRGFPTLEDLGITPIEMESQIPWELRVYRHKNDFAEYLGEMIQPPPPKTVPLN